MQTASLSVGIEKLQTWNLMDLQSFHKDGCKNVVQKMLTEMFNI